MPAVRVINIRMVFIGIRLPTMMQVIVDEDV
jgi:hypothetical protein